MLNYSVGQDLGIGLALEQYLLSFWESFINGGEIYRGALSHTHVFVQEA